MEEDYEYILINRKKFREAESFISLYRNPPRNTLLTKGLWIHGLTGDGKDYCIRNSLDQLEYNWYNKNDTKWFDGYRNERVIYLPDLGKNTGVINYLKHWLDRYTSIGEVKGSAVALNHFIFIISS